MAKKLIKKDGRWVDLDPEKEEVVNEKAFGFPAPQNGGEEVDISPEDYKALMPRIIPMLCKDNIPLYDSKLFMQTHKLCAEKSMLIPGETTGEDEEEDHGGMGLIDAIAKSQVREEAIAEIEDMKNLSPEVFDFKHRIAWSKTADEMKDLKNNPGIAEAGARALKKIIPFTNEMKDLNAVPELYEINKTLKVSVHDNELTDKLKKIDFSKYEEGKLNVGKIYPPKAFLSPAPKVAQTEKKKTEECKSGVYTIRCQGTMSVYVGYSKDVFGAMRKHRSNLLRVVHNAEMSNKALEDYMKYPFTFEPVCMIIDAEEQAMRHMYAQSISNELEAGWKLYNTNIPTEVISMMK